MSKFDELLGELETLAKAQPADGDDKIVAAAGEGGGQGGAGEPDGDEGAGEGMGDGDGDEGKGKPMMAKSFRVKLADGTEVDAQDGTEMVKALESRIEANETVLAKALETAVSMLKSQGEQIAALSSKIKAMGSEGKGRKAVLTVTEKPAAGGDLAKSTVEQGMKPEEFMAKALSAQRDGRLTGIEVATAEAYLNRGQPVPANIIERVIQG